VIGTTALRGLLCAIVIAMNAPPSLPVLAAAASGALKRESGWSFFLTPLALVSARKRGGPSKCRTGRG
jgi:hypothetical protein